MLILANLMQQIRCRDIGPFPAVNIGNLVSPRCRAIDRAPDLWPLHVDSFSRASVLLSLQQQTACVQPLAPGHSRCIAAVSEWSESRVPVTCKQAPASSMYVDAHYGSPIGARSILIAESPAVVIE
jgi:hypothetical protein